MPCYIFVFTHNDLTLVKKAIAFDNYHSGNARTVLAADSYLFCHGGVRFLLIVIALGTLEKRL